MALSSAGISDWFSAYTGQAAERNKFSQPCFSLVHYGLVFLTVKQSVVSKAICEAVSYNRARADGDIFLPPLVPFCALQHF